MQISVVMPLRNVESTLAEALDALLAQEWSGDWEVVLVNNRSTDSTLAICKEYAVRDERVRVVQAAERDGLAYARQTGFDATTSPMVLICDGDDVVVPGWLAAMASALEQGEVATGPCDVSVLNPQWLADSRGVYPPDRPLEWQGIFPIASGGNFGVRRDTFIRIGGFKDDFIGAEDHEFSLRIFVAKIPLIFEPNARLLYRMRGEPRTLWRQGLTYGRNRPKLRREVERSGLRPPGRFSGWRSWVRLLTTLPRLRSSSGRAQWCWVAGVRLGHLQGSIRDRTVFL